jgi:hypothetical protein
MPATPGVEHEQDALERRSVLDRRPSIRPARWWPRREQRLEQLPQPIIDQPLLLGRRHDQRLDLVPSALPRNDTPRVLRPGLSRPA